MKYSFVILPETPANVTSLDALAARGRVGILEGGREDGVADLFGRLLGRGDTAGICLSCSVMNLGKDGNIDMKADESDVQELSLSLDGTEIDGVSFESRAEGNRLILTLSGEGLSSKIVPNTASPGMSLPQVSAYDKGAKRTASIVNKFIYRTAKKKQKALIVTDKPGRLAACNFREKFGVGSSLLSANPWMRAVAKSAGVSFSNSLEDSMESEFSFIHIEKTDEAALKRISEACDVMMLISGSGAELRALVHGGVLAGRERNFSAPACSRGFRLAAEDFIPWVLRATGSGF
jgi:hypothetical protein